MTRLLRLLRWRRTCDHDWEVLRTCDHDWEVLTFIAVDEEFEYVVLQTCTRCEEVLAHAPDHTVHNPQEET